MSVSNNKQQKFFTPYNRFSIRDYLKFIIPSALGLMLFTVPFKYDGHFTIPIAIFSNLLQQALTDFLSTIILIVIVISACVTVLAKLTQHKLIINNHFLNSLFNISNLWCFFRVLGAFFAILCYFKIGSLIIWADSTGGLIFNNLLPMLFCIFCFAGLLLPLLTNFGLLEFIGAFMTPIMRPLFKLPGCSAIDAIASWLGDGSVGLIMTSKQYNLGYYTKREAAIIATSFSTVSITFALVVAKYVNLQHMFIHLILTSLLTCIFTAMIISRIPPLSRKPDLLINNKTPDIDANTASKNQKHFSWGLQQALQKAQHIKNPSSVVKDGIRSVFEIIFGVLPIVMAMGCFALILSEYTPFFMYLGQPFVPVLKLLHIPEAEKAAETIVLGFADMLLPAILATTINSELTRFIIAALSLTQLIYLSEIGALILSSKIPLNLFELFIIFLLRTLIALPIISIIGHSIFSA